MPYEFRIALRERFRSIIVVAGRYTAERGETLIAAGLADLVTFGVSFLANPDLPQGLAAGWPLNVPDPDPFFGDGTKGYVDYPTYEALARLDVAAPC